MLQLLASNGDRTTEKAVVFCKVLYHLQLHVGYKENYENWAIIRLRILNSKTRLSIQKLYNNNNNNNNNKT